MEQSAFTVYFDTLTKTTVTNFAKDTLQNLVPHELGPAETVTIKDVIHYFENHGIASPNVELMSEMEQAVRGILDGKVVIFLTDGLKLSPILPLMSSSVKPQSPLRSLPFKARMSASLKAWIATSVSFEAC